MNKVNIQPEDVDKIIRTMENSKPVYDSVEKALEDGKFTAIEGAMLLVNHGGKAIRFVQDIKEIGKELADMEPEEAEEVMNKYAELYGNGNPNRTEAMKHYLKGIAEIRTGFELMATE